MKDNSHQLPAMHNSSTVPVSGRMIAPDVMRLLACVSVVSIHFFLNSGFYDTPIRGANMIIMLAARLFFTTSVPLFIILTGYLMSDKKPSAKYYAKGMRVVWLYLLASLAIIIYRVFIKHHIDMSNALWGILRFRTAPYAWYVEMYLGLYLLIPFLNILYKNILSRRWKLVLILTCFSLSALPKLLNSFNFVQQGWWLNPTLSTDYQHLIPQGWLFGYPVLLYFIGAYLREYGATFSKAVRRIVLLVTLVVYVLFCLWRAHGDKFPWGQWTDWEFPLNIIDSTLLASLLLEKKYRRMPSALGKILAYVSGLSLQLFLVSYIFDTEYYPLLKQLIPQLNDRMWGYFAVVLAVFLSSVILSAMIDLIYRLFGILYRSLKRRIKSRSKPDEAVLSGE